MLELYFYNIATTTIILIMIHVSNYEIASFIFVLKKTAVLNGKGIIIMIPF